MHQRIFLSGIFPQPPHHLQAPTGEILGACWVFMSTTMRIPQMSLATNNVGNWFRIMGFGKKMEEILRFVEYM